MSGDLYADLHGECDEREHETGPGDEEAADDECQVHVEVGPGHLYRRHRVTNKLVDPTG